MILPKLIQDNLKEEHYEVDNIGMSNSKVLCFPTQVLKIEKINDEALNEYEILKWLNGKLPVPMIDAYTIADGNQYILMSKLDGNMSCDTEYMDHPHRLMKLLADALNLLWKVPIKDCPRDYCLDYHLKRARYHVEHDLCSMDDAEEGTYGEGGVKDPKDLLHWLETHRPKEEFVFTHGDFCLPNVFFKDNKLSGFIDLGRSGIGDKYRDIAICYRSLKSNYAGKYGGKTYENVDVNLFFEYLGIQPDWEKIKYYILLDELF